MDSPTGIIPEDMMFPGARERARKFITAMPVPAYLKRDLLFAWARTVGVRLQEWEVTEVLNSGPQPEGRK